MNTKSARGGAGSISMSSFSAGDFSFNSKGFYIPLTIGVLSFGLGIEKLKLHSSRPIIKLHMEHYTTINQAYI